MTGTEERRVAASEGARSGWVLQLGDRELVAGGETAAGWDICLDARWRAHGSVMVLDHGPETAVFIDGESWRLVELDPLAAASGDDPTAGRLTAPMPGRIIR